MAWGITCFFGIPAELPHLATFAIVFGVFSAVLLLVARPPRSADPRRIAICIPRRMARFGDLAVTSAALNYRALSDEAGGARRRDAWKALTIVIRETLDCYLEINHDTTFYAPRTWLGRILRNLIVLCVRQMSHLARERQDKGI